tara:strand:- start:84 stop:590 length:507 start_codon:yes stop_codon:yes gene_type:complete
MRPIKIDQKNEAKIAAQLGDLTMHTFSQGYQVRDLAAAASSYLTKLGLTSQASQKGAVVTFSSGGSVPSAYKWPRLTNCVQIERRATGWFLTSVERTSTYGDADQPVYTLTSEQDAICVAGFRKGWTVNPVQSAAETAQDLEDTAHLRDKSNPDMHRGYRPKFLKETL